MSLIIFNLNSLKEQAIEDPTNINIKISLGRAYMQEKDYQKAHNQFNLVLQLHPGNPTAQELLIEVNELIEQEKLAYNLNNEVKVSAENSDEDLDTEKWFEKSETTFKDVGGMKELKEEIKLGIVYPFEKPELYKKYGKKIGGGILLYGPPGCGKTHIARATAGEIKAMFLSLAIEDILNMWLGQSEKNLHKLFQNARNLAPTVIFIDEVDALGSDRMKTASSAKSLVNQFLTEMDNVDNNNDQVMVLGATNMPWQIDPAFRRPGRFDKIIFVPPPDEEARAEIFKIHLANRPTDYIDYGDLARRTNLFSGADISKVCDMATESIMREILSGGSERNISMQDLIATIKVTPITTREWFSTARNFAKYANESGTYSPILQYMRTHKLD